MYKRFALILIAKSADRYRDRTAVRDRLVVTVGFEVRAGNRIRWPLGRHHLRLLHLARTRAPALQRDTVESFGERKSAGP